jgi:hypothetical protein
MTEHASQQKHCASYARCSPKTLSQPNAKHAANTPAQVREAYLELKRAPRLPADPASYLVSHKGVPVPRQQTTQSDIYDEQVQKEELNEPGSRTRLLAQCQMQGETDKRR